MPLILLHERVCRGGGYHSYGSFDTLAVHWTECVCMPETDNQGYSRCHIKIHALTCMLIGIVVCTCEWCIMCCLKLTISLAFVHG